MATHLFSLIILVSVLGELLAQMVPCNSQQEPYTGPPLPVLPDQFQVHVEANIVQKQLTRNIVEYYDYTNNRAVIESHDHSTSEFVRSVIDFTTQEAREVYENGTCKYTMTNSSSLHFGFMKAANGTHLRTVKDLLYFGDQMGEKFIDGDKTVRGMPVNHWRACVSLPIANGTFTLDYYFTKGPGYIIDGAEVQVPVRAVINGTAHAVNFENRTASPEVHSFYHIYEFTDFHLGPIKDQSLFEIPIGTYCHSDINRKAPPELPQQFSVGLETMLTPNAGSPHMLNQQMFYDGPGKVMRVDLASPAVDRDILMYGKRPLSIIHDETNGMRYVIDRWEGNCTVVQYKPTDSMVTPEDIMAMFGKSFLYQGKKTLRGLSVESWAYFNTSDNTITEMLLQQQAPSDRRPVVPSNTGTRPKRVPAPGRGANAPYAPVGIYSRKVSQNTQPEDVVLYNLYGFSPSHPDPDVFDISQCYEMGHDYAYMSMKIEGTYEKDVQHNRREFVTSLRSAIARGAGISVMRVTSILVEADTKSASQLRVFFKLLDNSLNGKAGSKLPSLAAAKLNLASAVAGELSFDVQYPTIEQNFQVVGDSLWEVKSMYKDSGASSIKKYSSGAMAGLGIGMIVIGALLGLGVAYFIYKRIDISIPYEITH